MLSSLFLLISVMKATWHKTYPVTNIDQFFRLSVTVPECLTNSKTFVSLLNIKTFFPAPESTNDLYQLFTARHSQVFCVFQIHYFNFFLKTKSNWIRFHPKVSHLYRSNVVQQHNKTVHQETLLCNKRLSCVLVKHRSTTVCFPQC